MPITDFSSMPPLIAQPDQQVSAEPASMFRVPVAPAPSEQLCQNLGKIKSLCLPDCFVAGEQHAGSTFSKEFLSQVDPATRLVFQFSKHRLSPNAAAAVGTIVALPPHSLDSSEIASIRELLLEKASSDSFKIYFAKTEDLNGKTVLVIEGKHTKWQLHSRTIYIDFALQLTSSFTQEITYQAPSNLFNKHFLKVMKSLKTIVWL